MEEGAQGRGRRYLRADRIVFASEAGSIPSPAWRRRRPRNDTPAWVSDPNFTLRTAIWWQDPPAAAAAGHRRSTKRARVTAISEAILGLPEVTDRCSRSGEECAICLNDFRAEETLRAMPCAHAFHQNCISQWLRLNAVCPLCRHQLLPTTPTTPEEEDEEEEDLEWEDGAVVGESS